MVGWWWWTALVGCPTTTEGPEVVADYELAIVPHLLDDQRDDVLALAPDVKLLVRPPDGSIAVWYAGVATDGAALTIPDLGPIEAGTRIGIVFEPQSADATNWHRDRTIAFGEAVVDEALALGGQTAQLDIVAPRVDGMSRVAKMSGGGRRAAGAVAVLPDGRGFLFGGGDPDAFDPADDIFETLPTATGWSDLEKVAKIPPVTIDDDYGLDFDTGALVNLTATPIETPDGWRILLGGGRAAYGFTGDPTRAWLLWNPDTFQVDDQGTLLLPRSSHLAFGFADGRVMWYGGFVAGAVNPTVSFEIWDPDSHEVEIGGTDDLNVAGAGNNSAFGALVDGDAIVCSGGFASTIEDLVPSDRCFEVTSNGKVTALAPLPAPVYGGALAGLADGGVLVTGGTSQEIHGSFGASVAAEGVAYRWDSKADSWREVGPLGHPRAFHRAIGLPDGRVLVVGGTEQIGLVYDITGSWVRCSEIYDPDTDTFEETTCNDASAGADPALSVAGEYAMMLQGIQFDGITTDGGGAFGVMRLIPTIEE